MAFNFNWSPLLADTDRVRDMLTNALNKSPKPPIIVDDIIVNELNLGSTPPELEIKEIGDLAEDRFKGIFKMSYTGDAYLTLKTRVQANPLNTFLSTKPAFASPQPLAANSSLTIPVQITLSDIRLSGFVILVFSKQKGITIVFRNDPIEKLKVSSTFDSIPFVRDYLQKTIENQLRVLFMEDLPAIIHRLSLRMFSTEFQLDEQQECGQSLAQDAAPVDPLASPPLQPLGDGAVGSRTSSLDPPTEIYASFSQKNLLRLGALAESQRTLSLFTPGIRDTIYRAWASAANKDELSHGTNTPITRPPTLSRYRSSIAPPKSAWSSAASQTSDVGSQATRPTLMSAASTPSVYSLASGASRTRPGKKRKHRVVNLRRTTNAADASETASVTSSYDDSANKSVTGSTPSSAMREGTHVTSAPSSFLREGEINTPPRSPKKKVGFQRGDMNASADEHSGSRSRPITPPKSLRPLQPADDNDPTPRASLVLPARPEKRPQMSKLPTMPTFTSRAPSPELYRTSSSDTRRPSLDMRRSSSEMKLQRLLSAFSEGGTGGILEQAWMQKMATEIAKKVAEEKTKRSPWRTGSEDGIPEAVEAPPAYMS